MCIKRFSLMTLWLMSVRRCWDMSLIFCTASLNRSKNFFLNWSINSVILQGKWPLNLCSFFSSFVSNSLNNFRFRVQGFNSFYSSESPCEHENYCGQGNRESSSSTEHQPESSVSYTVEMYTVEMFP